ncbi:hypothetical protein M758_12G171200 [Ceratodon purpureus]|nr:hypothetical protein M758_12G171200 [Ceratodon purpureus]
MKSSAMEKIKRSLCVLLLLLLSFTSLAAGVAISQPTMPRPFLKGGMPAEGEVDGNSELMIQMKRELLAAHGRDTPSGYPPSPKINPPYHG